MMKYNKILVSKVLALRDDLGLIIEVNEGQPGKPNDLVLWLQYKAQNGDWAYKGSQGATGIRIPMTNELEKFITDGLKAGFEASKKYDSTKASKPQGGFDINALNALTADQKTALLMALTGQAQAPAPQTPSEPALEFANQLLNAMNKGKSTGKKK
jgi:hypothetical protein